MNSEISEIVKLVFSWPLVAVIVTVVLKPLLLRLVELLSERGTRQVCERNSHDIKVLTQQIAIANSSVQRLSSFMACAQLQHIRRTLDFYIRGANEDVLKPLQKLLDECDNLIRRTGGQPDLFAHTNSTYQGKQKGAKHEKSI